MKSAHCNKNHHVVAQKFPVLGDHWPPSYSNRMFLVVQDEHISHKSFHSFLLEIVISKTTVTFSRHLISILLCLGIFWQEWTVCYLFLCLYPSSRWDQRLSIHLCMCITYASRQRHSLTSLLSTSSLYFTILHVNGIYAYAIQTFCAFNLQFIVITVLHMFLLVMVVTF